MHKSAFDGSFYDSDKGDLRRFVDSAIKRTAIRENPGSAFAYVAPHAGYMYSGKIAAFAYKSLALNKRLESTDTVIVVGPNHTGMGRPISVSMDDWKTPLGNSVNDKELSRAIVDSSEYIERDEEAHIGEHSIEVQLPFLQTVAPEKRLVFICMGDQSLNVSELLSEAIIGAARGLGRRVMVIASSDMNHYESAETAKIKDSVLIEAMKALDYRRFNALVGELDESACGYGPITVAMRFSKSMGAKKGLVLRYGNSGEATGDYSGVVAYLAFAMV